MLDHHKLLAIIIVVFLILDNYSSVINTSFDYLYEEDYSTIYTPSSHLQPLDVSSFEPLKHLYGQRI